MLYMWRCMAYTACMQPEQSVGRDLWNLGYRTTMSMVPIKATKVHLMLLPSYATRTRHKRFPPD